MFDYIAFFIGFFAGNAFAVALYRLLRAYLRLDTPDIWYCEECDDFIDAESPCKHLP